MPAKSCSLDHIPTWLLKRLTPHIAPVICKLCNLSLHNGVFPTQLKQALVLPILKKNLDPDVASSYRPISNLPCVSKVIERVVARRFSSHLSHSNLLPARQSAYRPFHSTETAVLSVHNDLAWLAPSTMVKFHCSCCLTSAQISTPWIIKFYCQYYPNALLWPTLHSAGSALTSLTAHNSSRTLGVVHPVSQWTVVCHKDRY